ncbi:hypothetical protein BDZ97DRAFT_1853120 [Flammula alnicola]|nr:hypothetical protein BDZ97DRAFT_1853120 [Flammula alnicola]
MVHDINWGYRSPDVVHAILGARRCLQEYRSRWTRQREQTGVDNHGVGGQWTDGFGKGDTQWKDIQADNEVNSDEIASLAKTDLLEARRGGILGSTGKSGGVLVPSNMVWTITSWVEINGEHTPSNVQKNARGQRAAKDQHLRARQQRTYRRRHRTSINPEDARLAALQRVGRACRRLDVPLDKSTESDSHLLRNYRIESW